MKIVLNRDVGGFDLSNRAFERLIQLGFPHIHEKNERKEDFGSEDVKIIEFTEEIWTGGSKYGILQNSYAEESVRSHPLVVQAVEELGLEAKGGFSKLEIVEIPDDVDWRLEFENGFEKVIDWDTGGRIY